MVANTSQSPGKGEKNWDTKIRIWGKKQAHNSKEAVRRKEGGGELAGSEH